MIRRSAIWSLLVVSLALPFLSLAVMAQEPIHSGLPTPTPARPVSTVASDPGSRAAAQLPDLIVSQIETIPEVPLVGQVAVISVTIHNDSDQALATGNNFFADLYIDPIDEPKPGDHQIISPSLGLPWGVQGFQLPAGTAHILTTTWYFTDVKTFEVWVQVDSEDTVAERDESNNLKKENVRVLTEDRFVHDTHQDFLTNMASTLENDDPDGVLRLGRFVEPPFIDRPFTNAACEIGPSLVVNDYEMQAVDTQINTIAAGRQTNPYLVADGLGAVIAVWEDGRNGETANRDIYLRYSTDYGATWGSDLRVNDDPLNNGVNQLNPVAALSEAGDLLVAWQDQRNGNSDIFVQQYRLAGGALNPVGQNIIVGGSAAYNQEEQINPDIAVDEEGGFHVAWQDNRNGHFDIFATSYISTTGTLTWTLVRRVHDDVEGTQQVNPAIEVLDWLEVTAVDYDIAPVSPYTVTVNRVISQPAQILVVAWEDDRQGNEDIAMVISTDGGETFGVDQLITAPTGDGDQRKPRLTLTKGTTELDFQVPVAGGSTTSVPILVPVSDIHTVWEGYSSPDNNDRDIFYSRGRLEPEQVGESNLFDFTFQVGDQEKINQNDERAWQTRPVDQQSPELTAVPCNDEPDSEDYNLFITWADSRNYDDANYDIYYALKSTCSTVLEGNNLLNDGVRLHHFDPSDPNYAEYDPGQPPPARQLNPSIAADIRLEGNLVSRGHVYLAWEDDRAGEPQVEKDVFFARSNLTFFNQPGPALGTGSLAMPLYAYGAGSQISNILDSQSITTTWFAVSWSGATPGATYVTVQTRLGNTITDVLQSAWLPRRYPYQPQLGDCAAANSGAPLAGYDAPGQHIEDAAGRYWPQARYIQYRVNFFSRDSAATPTLDSLTIYYQDNRPQDNPVEPDDFSIYLPLIRR